MTSVTTRKDDKLVIRLMEPRDITSIMDIGQKIRGNETRISTDDLITGDLGGELDLSIVAQIEDNVVGCVLARRAYMGEPGEEAVLIQIIGVAPDYQGQRIGSMLMKALEATCDSKGIALIRTMVTLKDSQLRKFFKLVGFETGQSVECYKMIW